MLVLSFPFELFNFLLLNYYRGCDADIGDCLINLSIPLSFLSPVVVYLV